MPPTVIDRRAFTSGVAALALTAPTAINAEPSDTTTFAANIRNRDGSFAAVAYSAEQGLIRKVGLPARGHDLAYNPQADLLVAFARRPGNFAVAFDVRRRSPPIRFTTPANRHFYGHGVFSPDGHLLYATENDFENGAGVIGIYDCEAGFKRIGEHSTYGVGPHDLNLLGDGQTLVIANGGVATHPDFGRKPLNLATMQSSLVYIDRRSGDLIERHDLTTARQKLSIRHLDVGAGDRVVIGCQFKGPKSAQIELVGFHQRGQDLVFLPSEPPIARALRHYVSSIAIDRAGEVAGLTSSRGQQVVLVDIRMRTVLGVRRFADVSGIAPHRTQGFVLTGGHGDVGLCSTQSPVSRLARARWSWDNHATSLAG